VVSFRDVGAAGQGLQGGDIDGAAQLAWPLPSCPALTPRNSVILARR
jgi:hypothetical protein